MNATNGFETYDSTIVKSAQLETDNSTANHMLKKDSSGYVANATYSDVVALWTSCSAGYLQFDGTCATPAGGVTGSTTPVSGDASEWDTHLNLSANQFIGGYATHATAGTTTVLDVASPYNQYFTGTTTQTVTLPVVTTLVNGQSFMIFNNSTGVVTVQTSGGNTVLAIPASSSLFVQVKDKTGGTGLASWQSASPSTGSMTYPGAGVAVSTGSAWGTSLNITAISDSTSTTSSTTAASATAVKAAYDHAGSGSIGGTLGAVANKVPKSSGTGGSTLQASNLEITSDDNVKDVRFSGALTPITTGSGGGVTALTVASSKDIYLTGTAAHEVDLPQTSTLYINWDVMIWNLSSNTVTVKTYGTNTVLAIPAGGSLYAKCIAITGDTLASWQAAYPSIYAGSNGTYGVGLQENDSTIATPTGFAGIIGFVGGLPVWKYGAGTIYNIASLTGTETLTNKTLTAASLGSSYLSTTKTVGATSTTANLLVKIDTAGTVITAATSDVGILGIAVSTVTTGNPVEVATRGIINCIADNTTVVGNIAIVGTSTAGRCRDSGQSSSNLIDNSTNIVGKFLTVASTGNPASVQLYGPGHYGTQVNTLASGATGTDPLFTTTPSGASNGTGLKIAGSGLTAGSVYYMASGGLTLAKADSASTLPGICIADTTTSCMYSGVFQYSGTQSWTVGNQIYVSSTSAGALVTTAPSSGFVQKIGIATGVGTILIMPSLDIGGI
jgi:hypothetical protein